MKEIRRDSAVRDHWNAMTHILTATIAKPGSCFWGKIGWQPRWTDVTIEHKASFENVLQDIARRNPMQQAQRPEQRARFTEHRRAMEERRRERGLPTGWPR